MTNRKGTEKPAELKRGTQKKNGKEGAAGEEKFELRVALSHRMGGPQERTDISWPSSPIGTVSCTACVLRSNRTGGPQEPPDVSWPSSPIYILFFWSSFQCFQIGTGTVLEGEFRIKDLSGVR